MPETAVEPLAMVSEVVQVPLANGDVVVHEQEVQLEAPVSSVHTNGGPDPPSPTSKPADDHILQQDSFPASPQSQPPAMHGGFATPPSDDIPLADNERILMLPDGSSVIVKLAVLLDAPTVGLDLEYVPRCLSSLGVGVRWWPASLPTPTSSPPPISDKYPSSSHMDQKTKRAIMEGKILVAGLLPSSNSTPSDEERQALLDASGLSPIHDGTHDGEPVWLLNTHGSEPVSSGMEGDCVPLRCFFAACNSCAYESMYYHVRRKAPPQEKDKDYVGYLMMGPADSLVEGPLPVVSAVGAQGAAKLVSEQAEEMEVDGGEMEGKVDSIQSFVPLAVAPAENGDGDVAAENCEYDPAEAAAVVDGSGGPGGVPLAEPSVAIKAEEPAGAAQLESFKQELEQAAVLHPSKDMPVQSGAASIEQMPSQEKPALEVDTMIKEELQAENEAATRLELEVKRESSSGSVKKDKKDKKEKKEKDRDRDHKHRSSHTEGPSAIPERSPRDHYYNQASSSALQQPRSPSPSRRKGSSTDKETARDRDQTRAKDSERTRDKSGDRDRDGHAHDDGDHRDGHRHRGDRDRDRDADRDRDRDTTRDADSSSTRRTTHSRSPGGTRLSCRLHDRCPGIRNGRCTLLHPGDKGYRPPVVMTETECKYRDDCNYVGEGKCVFWHPRDTRPKPGSKDGLAALGENFAPFRWMDHSDSCKFGNDCHDRTVDKCFLKHPHDDGYVPPHLVACRDGDICRHHRHGRCIYFHKAPPKRDTDDDFRGWVDRRDEPLSSPSSRDRRRDSPERRRDDRRRDPSPPPRRRPISPDRARDRDGDRDRDRRRGSERSRSRTRDRRGRSRDREWQRDRDRDRDRDRRDRSPPRHLDGDMDAWDRERMMRDPRRDRSVERLDRRSRGGAVVEGHPPPPLPPPPGEMSHLLNLIRQQQEMITSLAVEKQVAMRTAIIANEELLRAARVEEDFRLRNDRGPPPPPRGRSPPPPHYPSHAHHHDRRMRERSLSWDRDPRARGLSRSPEPDWHGLPPPLPPHARPNLAGPPPGVAPPKPGVRPSCRFHDRCVHVHDGICKDLHPGDPGYEPPHTIFEMCRFGNKCEYRRDGKCLFHHPDDGPLPSPPSHMVLLHRGPRRRPTSCPHGELCRDRHRGQCFNLHPGDEGYVPPHTQPCPHGSQCRFYRRGDCRYQHDEPPTRDSDDWRLHSPVASPPTDGSYKRGPDSRSRSRSRSPKRMYRGGGHMDNPHFPIDRPSPPRHHAPPHHRHHGGMGAPMGGEGRRGPPHMMPPPPLTDDTSDIDNFLRMFKTG